MTKFTATLIASAMMFTGVAQVHAKDAGFKMDREAAVRKDGKISIRRNEPSLTLAIRGDITATQVVDVIPVRLPPNPPDPWGKELSPDMARTITVTNSEGKQQSLPLQAAVFRALYVSEDEERMEVWQAVINPDATAWFTLLPPGRTTGLQGSLYIVSNDGQHVLTTLGQSVDLSKIDEAKLKKGRLPEGFTKMFPSPITGWFTIRRSESNGKVFFQDLERYFPEDITFNGIRYSARPFAEEFQRKYTNLNSLGDRAASCGNFSIGPGGLPALAIGLLFSAPKVFGADDCLAGEPRQEKAKRESQKRRKET